MLRFYIETGTIVYFGAEVNDNNFVIINPQWLLNCLGCIMYDVQFHGTKKLKLETRLIKAVDQLESNGLLSRNLLDSN